ncbi:S8 family serine peptidase [Pantanalinema rosaneae CENA516]
MVQQMIKPIARLGSGLGLVLVSATSALSAPVQANSIGDIGIDALRLHDPPYELIGRKIAIGQVEIGRPGVFGLDKAASQNQAVKVTQVFFRNSPAKVNANVDAHAQGVASIMVSLAKGMKGVAPGARLYSSAAGTPRRYGQPEECLSAQHVAIQNGGDVRAINFSFGESLKQDPRPNALLDGNALLTQCIDWSTRVHNTLYVVAGNQGKGGISIPTDNYNGINVAFSTRVQGIYTKVDFANLGDPSLSQGKSEGIESNVGPRRAIGLVAPGDGVSLLNLSGRVTISSGTSFAAPHVTATVALLQEYGDRQLRQSCPAPGGCSLSNWGLDARRPEVMKAVLLNAADKLEDNGDGLNLGMTRTLLDKSNRSWLESDAYRDRSIPLNAQMGTGHLNAFRAYQQFSPGQWSPQANVPTIGWDYRTVTDRDTAYQDYVIDQPLQADSVISATLTWNRLVDLVDKNGNGEFDVDESFRDRGLNDLNLYLMRVEDDDIRQSIWSSESNVDSVEHIFYQVPTTGRYKLRVTFHRRVNDATQPYALAWWAKAVK